MSEPKNSYVVMRKSGRVMTLGSGMGASVHSEGSYLHILDKIASEHNSAGSNYDPPEKLFLNGKCVVESRLAHLAWEYDRDLVAAKTAAVREVQNLHTPSWRPDSERAPGYNPPGIDEWTVRRRPR